jgi:hypothetical protein
MEVTMIDTPDTNEELGEPTPYQNNYRTRLDEPDEPTDTEASATPNGKSKVGGTENGNHNFKKRYDDLKKHYDQKLSDWRQEKEDLLVSSKQTKKENIKLPKSQEDLAKFKEEYPDIFGIVETVAHMQADSRVSDIEEHLEILRDRERDLERGNAQKELLAAHPDFVDIKEDQDFIDWLEEQPESISNGVTQNATDVKWAARTLDLYKADKGIKTKSKKSNSGSAAKQVRTSSGTREIAGTQGDKRIWTSDEISRLRPEQFAKVEKELEQANREGRIRP